MRNRANISENKPAVDYNHELIRMEEDSEYNEIQEYLFHDYFDVVDLEKTTLHLRWEVDSAVRQITGKPFDGSSKGIRWFTKIDHYPLGFCNDITHIVEAILKWWDSISLSPSCSEFSGSILKRMMHSEIIDRIPGGKQWLPAQIRKFEKAGGIFGSVWGIMPNESCFQWFILAGNHILNVANDAADRQAFPIDITRRDPNLYRSIRDYFDYTIIAEKYWGLAIYRNTIIPSIAPVCPIISIDQRWDIQFPRPATLTKRSIKSWFELARQILESKELKNPPAQLENFFQSLGFPGIDSISETYNTYAETIWNSLKSNVGEEWAFPFQRAVYFAQKAEYEWFLNFNHDLWRSFLGVVEK